MGSRLALIGVFGVVAVAPGSASAVKIRHDVPENQYLELARRAEFRSGLVTILDHRANYTGVLISPTHVLTCGHPVIGFMPRGKSHGPFRMAIRIGERKYQSEYAYLHPKYPRTIHYGGSDIAMIRLKRPGVRDLTPSKIWIGGLKVGDSFVGIGQGRSGTGADVEEPKPMGVFRGYENTIDYFFEAKHFTHFRADFDSGDDYYNTLSRELYGAPAGTNSKIQGTSSKRRLPLEGTPTGGDSGSGVWVKRGQHFYLAGIFSYYNYSQYGGQASYVNLSDTAIAEWIKSVARRERIRFPLVTNEK